MKSLRFLFALAILSTLFFSSCTKDEPIIEEQKPLSDAELVEALYASDALIGKGEVKEDGKYSFSIPLDELPKDLRDQFDGKETWELEEALHIPSAHTKAIWGDQIIGTALEDGLEIEGKTHTVARTYMTPGGESLTEQVEADPTILASARDRIDYIYIEHVEIEFEDGTTIEIIYIEACTILF